MEALLTTTDVLNYLGLPSSEQAEMERVVNAVAGLIVSYKGELDPWPEYYRTGAVMLAARIYRRRNSPAGVEALGELGPVYVSRNDPDLAQLLKLGRYAPPMVG